jgi:hypothetical protein
MLRRTPWCVKAEPDETHAILAYRDFYLAFDHYLTVTYRYMHGNRKNHLMLPSAITGPCDFQEVFEVFETDYCARGGSLPAGTDFLFRYNLAYARWVSDPVTYQFSGPMGSAANPYWFPVRRELFPDV